MENYNITNSGVRLYIFILEGVIMIPSRINDSVSDYNNFWQSVLLFCVFNVVFK